MGQEFVQLTLLSKPECESPWYCQGTVHDFKEVCGEGDVWNSLCGNQIESLWVVDPWLAQVGSHGVLLHNLLNYVCAQ